MQQHLLVKMCFAALISCSFRIDKSARLVGISDAVGAMEMFEPVFQDGKMALLGRFSLLVGSLSCYMRLFFNYFPLKERKCFRNV